MKIWLIMAAIHTTFKAATYSGPVGLIAQLVEHCTGIAVVMGSNPVQVCGVASTARVKSLSCDFLLQ